MTTPVIGRYPAIFYTSNTPQSTGETRCDMRRFLGTHAGPHGTGWRLKATAVPLATGIAFHKGQELIAEWVLDWQRASAGAQLKELPLEVTAWAASEAAARYVEKATAKGLLVTANDATAAGEQQRLIAEQATLIEGLIWTWALVRLPALLANYRLIASEVEVGIMLDCSCGLGEDVADLATHQARSCAGIWNMGKPDQIWQSVFDHSYLYVQFKSWGSTSISKERKWEHARQLLVDMEAASRAFGVPIDAAVVDVSIKGWRGRERGAPETEPKTQHSPLCYGYFDPGNPPMREPAWASAAKWQDEFGANRSLPKSYGKVAVWDEANPMPAVRPGATRVESYIRQYFTPKQFGESVKVLGPFPRPQLRVPLGIKAIKAEERRWRADVEFLREQGAVMPGDPLVDDVIGRSWECTDYDGTPCEFQRVCNRHPGWEDPETMGMYERRRPHHAPECAAVLALGVELPEDEEGVDDGE